MVAVTNLVICGAVVAVLGAVRGGNAPAAFTPATSTTTDEPPGLEATPPPDGPSTTEEPGLDTRFTEVTGPGGMTTRIPAGWPTRTSTGPGAMQADDPADTSTWLRYGGSVTPVTDSYDVHADYERQFAAGKANYRSIRLARTVVRGNSAIDWEFEYDADEGRRHVRSVYWLYGGYEYFVYASSPVPRWPEVRKVLDVMLTYSTP